MTTIRPFTVSNLALLSMLAVTACGDDNARLPFDTDRHIGAWLELWNTYDLSLVGELFLTGSSVTYFSSEREGLIVGIDEVRAHHEGFGFVEGGRQAEQDLWVEDLHTTTFWPAAVVTGVWRFGDRDGAPEDAQRGPFTFVYVQRADTYRLAHLNFSTYLETPEGEDG